MTLTHFHAQKIINLAKSLISNTYAKNPFSRSDSSKSSPIKIISITYTFRIATFQFRMCIKNNVWSIGPYAPNPPIFLHILYQVIKQLSSWLLQPIERFLQPTYFSTFKIPRVSLYTLPHQALRWGKHFWVHSIQWSG